MAENDLMGVLLIFIYYTTIQNTFATGTVTATGSFVGGLLGNANRLALVQYNYAVNDVTANNTTDVGAFIGYQTSLDPLPIFSDNYFVTETSETSIGATGQTLAELQCPQAPGDTNCSASVYTGWDTTIWNFAASTQLPGLVIDGVIHRP